MRKNILSCAPLLLLMANALAQAPVEPAAEPAAAPPESEVATPPAEEPAAQAESAAEPGSHESAALGMSILGNQEAPKSLVIVPWKSSEIGAGIGVARALDTGIHAVDKDVFMRELRYYEIRTGGAN
jgi:hypothetical protein